MTIASRPSPPLEATPPVPSGRARVLAEARFAVVGASAGLAVLRALARHGLGEVPPLDAARRIQRWAASLLPRLGVEVVVTGEPPTGCALLAANHRSYLDIIAIAAQSPAVFLAKAEVADWPLIGWGARKGHTVFVQRDDAASRKGARVQLARLLEQGVSVIVFPEGTTSHGPGVLPFRPGPFQLAAAAGLPVVPVAVSYDDEADHWVGDVPFRGHFLGRFGTGRHRVRVAFGPALRGDDATRLHAEAEAWVVNALQGPTTPGVAGRVA